MNTSSDSGSSETILEFSMQVKATIPLYSTQKNSRAHLRDEQEKIYFKNRYCPQVLVDNWYEEQLRYVQEDSYLKLKRGPNETTYDVEFKVPYIDNFAAFNKVICYVPIFYTTQSTAFERLNEYRCSILMSSFPTYPMIVISYVFILYLQYLSF
jgi:hypothetical protein